jgi:hypothetical protein
VNVLRTRGVTDVQGVMCLACSGLRQHRTQHSWRRFSRWCGQAVARSCWSPAFHSTLARHSSQRHLTGRHRVLLPMAQQAASPV